DFEIGMIASAYSLATFVSSNIFGRLSDFYDRKKIILLGLLLSAIFFFAQSFSTSPIHLLAIRALLGFSLGIFPAALISYAYEKNRNIGYFSSFGSLGWAIGQLLAGMIVIYEGIFTFGAFLVCLAFLIVLYEKISGNAPLERKGSLSLIKSNFSVYLAFFLRHTGASAVWLIFPIHLAEIGISRFWIGVIYFTNSFLQFIVMQRIEKYDPRILLNIGTLLSALAFLLYSIALNVWEFLGIQFIIATAWSAMYVGSLRLLLERNAERNTVTGFLNSTIHLSTILGSIFGGIVAQNFGYKACFYFGAILSLFAISSRVKN
ncbi:MAG: MFS transporter, partial [Archaeoglobaceae archaeon]